jgi:GR25 family glycosyltransferase involved in LPS biosynthesis
MSKAIKHAATGIIDEAFPYLVCINLDRRPERWQQMQRKFAQHGINSVQRFPALDGEKMKLPANWVHTPGAYGCLLSHLQVVREARRLSVASVLILEDDVVFDHQLEKKFSAGIGQLPSDWDMLFFGALHRDEPIKVAANIGRITKAYSTYAYVLRDTVFDDFIELNRKTEVELDNNSIVLQQRFNCYCFMPHLAWVETDHSDAQQRLMDHWYLRESLVLFGPEVDRLLSETTIVFAHENHSGSAAVSENLMYLVRYYHNYFSPHIAMVIVEQGAEPTVNATSLPGNCKYVFLRDTNPFDRERCFATGTGHSDPSRKRVILSDNNIYLETLHIRANLRMCERYDYVTGFSKLIDLNKQDSLRLRNAKNPQGIDFIKNASQNIERQGVCLFLNRETIQVVKGGGEDPEQGSSSMSLHPSPQHRVFQSPNHALRLQQD